MKILIAAGGTGGHLFPALAVAETIKEITKINLEIHFFGRADKIEGRVVPSLGYPLHTTKLKGLTRLLSPQTLLIPFRIAASTIKLIRLIRKEEIDAVLCTGAYISYPAGIAASYCKAKLFLMESNVNPGKTISMLAAKADTIFTSFDETAGFFAASVQPKLKNYGNPIRNAIINKAWLMVQRPDDSGAYQQLGLDKTKPVVLVFGGSLGAKALNEAVLRWKDQIAKAPYQIVWQTGKSLPKSAPELRNLPPNIKHLEFIDDMAAAYAVADLVVCRSGAATVTELCIMGKPAVLVPLPSASNNEQHHNATYLAKHGAAALVSNADIGDHLLDTINKLVLDSAHLQSMGDAARTLARPDAGYRIAKDIIGALYSY